MQHLRQLLLNPRCNFLEAVKLDHKSRPKKAIKTSSTMVDRYQIKIEAELDFIEDNLLF